MFQSSLLCSSPFFLGLLDLKSSWIIICNSETVFVNSASVSFPLEIVQFHLNFHLGVFTSFVVDILRFIPVFEPLENDFSRLSYDFWKLQV